MDVLKSFRMQTQALLENYKKLRILVIGNVGSGKSTLINTLLGWEVAQVGSTLDSVTHEVEPFKRAGEQVIEILVTKKREVNGVIVTLWDSPGFQEVFMTPEKKKILLKNIEDKCQDVDLVVYCADMTRVRYLHGDDQTILDLTKVLGEKIWEKAIFALTYANKISLPASESCTLEQHFVKKCENWSLVLQRSLEKALFHKKVPILPVGYDRSRPLEAPSEKGWFSDFWTACGEKASILGFVGLLKVVNIQIIDENIIAKLLLKKLRDLVVTTVTDPIQQDLHFMLIDQVTVEQSDKFLQIILEEINKL